VQEDTAKVHAVLDHFCKADDKTSESGSAEFEIKA